MTVTSKLDLNTNKMNGYAKYLHQSLFHSQVIV